MKLENKYGYVDTSGNVVIPLKFDNAECFSEGLAAVNFGNRWDHIDRNGESMGRNFGSAGNFYDGVAFVYIDGGWGAIDKSGAVIIEPRFEEVNYFTGGCTSRGSAAFMVSATMLQ